ncbi:MAG: DUF87 domain-containing protein [Kiritimatiellales bacterium]
MKTNRSRLSPVNIPRLFQELRSHGLDTIPRIERLMNCLDQNSNSPVIIEYLQEEIKKEVQHQSRNPDSFRRTAPREDHHLSGGIELGTMPQFDFPYGINVEMLVKHLLILGMIGGGKTTVIKNLLQQILQLADPPKLMILERKQEFTELLNLTPDMHVLDANTLAFNPLRPPPGIELNKWLGVFTETMINQLDIREASAGFIVEHTLRLVEEQKNEGRFPTLRDLRAAIFQQKCPATSKNGNYKDTVLNRLDILASQLPAMFSSENQLDMGKLMNNHCLILLHEITHSNVQNFLMSLLMAQAFLYRKLTAGLQTSLTNLVVFDEASGLFRREAEKKDHVPFIADLIQTARGYGIGLIAASQYSTDLAHSLLANADTRMMVGGFGRTEDVDTFLKLRGCSPEHRQYVITHPEVGKAFIADQRWPHIVECNMRLPDLPPPVSKEELKGRMEESEKFFAIEPKSIVKKPPPIQQAIPPKPNPTPQFTEESRDTRVLKHIYEDHFVTVAKRSDALGIPQQTLQKEIQHLENKALVKRYPVHYRPGRPSDLIKISPAGLELIGMPPKPPMKGRGSYLHKFYQLCVARYFKTQGYRVKIEGMADSKLIDVIAEKPGLECIAIEIELNEKSNPGHVIENLKNCMAAPRITRTLCLVTKNDEINRVDKLVTKHGLKRDALIIDRIGKYMEV